MSKEYNPDEFKKKIDINAKKITLGSWIGTLLGLSIMIFLLLLVAVGIKYCINYLL